MQPFTYEPEAVNNLTRFDMPLEIGLLCDYRHKPLPEGSLLAAV
jgi:hypothetical protein